MAPAVEPVAVELEVVGGSVASAVAAGVEVAAGAGLAGAIDSPVALAAGAVSSVPPQAAASRPNVVNAASA